MRLEIAGIAAGGDGVARAEGMVVFVPRSAPGDVIRALVTPGSRFARATIESIETPSPRRIEPPCPHYTMDRCGGCQLQHIEYGAQLDAKRSIIGDALRRIGKRAVDDPDVAPSEMQWRYRRKLTLHLRWVGDRWVAGLHPYDDPAAVFELTDCPITETAVMEIWAELRPAFVYLPRVPSLRVSVRLTAAGATCVVAGGRSWPGQERFFRVAPSLAELWWQPERGRLRRVATHAGAAAGASFIQVNAHVAEQLHAHVLARARHHEPRTVVDAYAGMGATTMELAADGRAVTAIELDADAVGRFASELMPPSRAIAGRVEEHLEASLPADVILLNPPRSGVDALVTEALQRVAAPPRAIIYVSCDPATLARDLARLPRYRVEALRGYDMFPQTAHVETVCELVPDAA
ncbi:MAG: class I SAM-dependent RNA methyltransferase [Gemmatimonadaceae bacterium]|nr:class I SAM-dependent RNA methyltransferase [Gemmatimonadaceae bacterium]